MDLYIILFFVLGLALVVFGSDFLVDGACQVARRSGISEFVIGMTIVGIGTSTPEMVVSFISALQGNADISVGNVVGSNIFNTMLILGLTAVIMPVAITKTNIRRDIPANILVTLVFIVLALQFTLFGIGDKNVISRLDGVLMLAMFALYMFLCFKHKDQSAGSGLQQTQNPEPVQDGGKNKPLAISILIIVGGLAALVIGGELFVDSAKAIARYLGWSDKFIAVTILAGGTSLPELATCIAASVKKKGQLALGNIIGSNISNILLILGGSALINPLNISGVDIVDLGFLVVSALVLPLTYISFRRGKVDRTDGLLMLAAEAGYMYYLISEL